ncbi:hypothetical protein DPV78_008063 [Talaromyces pinophilus]|nr:hypothetical protein DPV78_008063 [Talaromyces pinophilus]
MLTLIRRRAQAVHLVRAVRRSSGPRTAIFRAFCAGNGLEMPRDPSLNGAATGYKLEAIEDIRVSEWVLVVG